ncbi:MULTISPECIES: MFS transporter [unclassified Streptomyces]|uniref:MFS transporter n=1 Tax=unclassified Streptomyces TaxID=2593676 RepID=UPI0022502E36|nr:MULTISPECIES: MFS transporter [unclassified Streptomyces]MCX5329631.1 MFS transporter [Streptomyces sp. NBC_00140]MCX5359047.1 MFS transporter [Streptomyces sp. NBC_00124]
MPGSVPLRAPLLMAGSCLPVLGAVLIAPVLPKMQDHFDSVPGAKTLVPVVLTVPALALALLAPFAGVIVDRLGRRRLLVVATVLYALFGTAPLWLDSLGAIVASRVLVGITEAAIMTCCTTLIGDYYTGRVRDRYLALQTMCASASATAFFVIGGAAGSAGWRAPFWIYAVGLLLAPLMATALPRLRQDDASEELPTDSRPFPVRRLAGICALTVFGAMVFYTVPVETAYLLDDLGITSTGVIGLATALASAATVAGSIAFTRLPGTPVSRLPVVFALCGTGFVVMALASGPVLLIAGAVLNCLGTGVLLPSLLTVAMARLDYADRGRGTGLWTAAFFFGEFVCPLILIGLESVVGSLATAVGILGLASGLVAGGLLLAGRSAVVEHEHAA